MHPLKEIAGSSFSLFFHSSLKLSQYNPQLKNQLSSIHVKSLSPAFQQVTEHGENYKVMCNRYNLETR